MPRRLYAYLSSGSNNVVVRRPGALYSINGSLLAGGTVRVDDAHSFPQGALNLNASTSNTVGYFAPPARFDGVGFNAGLVVAFTSNTNGVTVEYETW